jgi:hypothetical protein
MVASALKVGGSRRGGHRSFEGSKPYSNRRGRVPDLSEFFPSFRFAARRFALGLLASRCSQGCVFWRWFFSEGRRKTFSSQPSGSQGRVDLPQVGPGLPLGSNDRNFREHLGLGDFSHAITQSARDLQARNFRVIQRFQIVGESGGPCRQSGSPKRDRRKGRKGDRRGVRWNAVEKVSKRSGG